MKLTKIAGKSHIVISKEEWRDIGRTAGWIDDSDKKKKLRETKKEINKIAKEISEKLYKDKLSSSSPRKTKSGRFVIDNIFDANGGAHSIYIELKPWVNKNNKKFELRSGIIIMVGPHRNKSFKRKRFSPKKIDSLIDYVKKIVAFNNKKDETRCKQSDKASQKREERFKELANTP